VTDEGSTNLDLIASATTEAGTVAELAAQPVEFEDLDHLTVALPPGWRLQREDLEPGMAEPTRSKGTIYVHDAASFVKAVNRRKSEPDPVLYADDGNQQLVAVLNDDDGDKTGWRDYRVALHLDTTPEWQHWTLQDGKMLSQEGFASHVEDGIGELQVPAPAEMLEIAQAFHATTAARFKSGRRLASGATQFAYEEEIEATAGEVSIPSELVLVLTPFVGAARYEMRAWFRFSLKRDQLLLGYKLQRPHDVLRAAFGDIRTEVAAALPDLDMLAGPAAR